MTTPQESHPALEESKQSLWMTIVAPTIWFAHFMLSYVAAALWCRTREPHSVGPVQLAIVGLAVFALIGIGWAGIAGWRMHRHGDETLPHDDDTSADRHRFLGFATVLLSSLSAVATIYVTVSVFFAGGCN
jgi:hypothetical protein